MGLWVDAATHDAVPPADVAGDNTLYGSLGAHVTVESALGGGLFGGSYGRALSGLDTEWLHGSAQWLVGRRAGPVGLRLAAGGFGLRYLEPFSFEAAALELRPVASMPAGPVVVSLSPRFTRGTWTADTLVGDLGVLGAVLEFERRAGRTTWTAELDALDVENGVTSGAFLAAGLAARFARGPWSVTADIRAQRNPLEDEVGGGLALDWAPAAGIQLRLDASRTLRDPVFGTAGTFALSAGMSVRVARARPPEPPRVVEVGERSEGGRVVRFTLRAGNAERVELLGDFNEWEPVAMERSDGVWQLSLVLEPGLHHFGFQVDGEWAVPPEAPGLIDDGWGRRNASIVVEP